MINYIKENAYYFSNKDIIISGANGYIGQELANQLVLNKINYKGIDRKPHKNSIHLVQNFEESESTRLIESLDCDYFVHAGTHSALAYEDNFVESFYEDMTSLRNILAGLASKPKCRLIYFSSSYVYSGISREDQVTEETVIAPVHNFGLAKSFFEQMLLRNYPNSIIFRLSSVFGGGNSLHPNAITNMANEVKNNEYLTVWGNGDRQMQYTYIEDVIKFIVRSPNLNPGIYNLGANDYSSVLDTANQIAQYFGGKVKKIPEKVEGFTLPFMKNDKIVTASDMRFSANQVVNLKTYLSQLNNSV
jgi:nucleoside-diphosphate-sugar epimerase